MDSIRFDSDMTLCWSCRAGDYIIWARCTDIFKSGRDAFEILDYWELRDGDHVLITNRRSDTPEGADEPGVKAADLWHLQTGDRLAWAGRPRANTPGERDKPILLGLIECCERAIACGDSNQPRFYPGTGIFLFGEPASEDASPYSLAAASLAFGAIVAKGLPRSIEL